MDAIFWLAAANAVIWIGTGFYLFFLAYNQKTLSLRIKQMELLNNDK